MKLEITKEEALEYFPNECQYIIGEISKLKMSEKLGIDNISYAFQYAIALGLYKTDDEYLSAVTGLSITGYFKPNKGTKRVPLTELPEIFRNKYLLKIKESVEKFKQEETRLKSLTDKEKEIERNLILDKLYDNPGFFHIRITKNRQ